MFYYKNYAHNVNYLRVKDNKFVYCALKKVIKSVMKKAEELGVDIAQIIHKVLV